jgi:hypothetical protein
MVTQTSHTDMETRLAIAVVRSWHTYDGYGNGYCTHCEASDGMEHKKECVVLVAEKVANVKREERKKLREAAEVNENIGSW